MNRIMKLFKCMTAFMLSLFLVLSGSVPVHAEDTGTDTPDNETVSAETISSDETEILLYVGETKQLTYTLSPENADETPVFTCHIDPGNYDSISVDENGLVTANSRGYTVVTASLANGNSIDYHVYVITGDPQSMENHSELYRVGLNQPKEITLYFDPYSSGYCHKHVVSDNPEVAEVVDEWTYNKTVAVYGKSTGTANITVTTDNGLSATVPVEVIDAVFADDITVETYNLNVYVGESLQLPYTLTPAEATEIPTFRSSEKYISVDQNGVVTATSSGSAQIYAEIANGQNVSYYITASYELESMTFAGDQFSVVPGAAQHLSLICDPLEAYYCQKHVVSSDPEIVQVNEEWIDYTDVSITGLKPGTATITVTADNGVSCSVEIVVLDGDYAETISPKNGSRVSIRPGVPYQLEYVLGSSDGRTEFKDEKVKFAVESGGYFMSVDENGVLTAFESGSGMVNAWITNGKAITYRVTAYELPESISFGQKKYAMDLNGNGININAYGEPSDAVGCPLTYTIEDTSIAEFDSTTHIIPKSIGTTRIIATAENGVYGTAELTVRTGNYADSIGKSDYSTNYLKTGQSTQLGYELYSDSGSTDFSDETVTWYVREGSEYVSVDDTGKVTALAGGSAVVVAEISNGRNITYSILTYDLPQSIQFEKSAYFVNVWSYSSSGITAYAMPESAGNCPLTYSVDDPEIIRLENWGNNDYHISPLKTGTAVVTATAENGISASVEVIVRDGNYADGITKNSYENICLKAGESAAIPYSLYSYKDGNDYSDETVSWSMEESTEGSFTLDNGTITALKNNESAVVTITITNGESASFNVYSADPIEQIVFDQNQEYRLPLYTRFNLIEEGYIHTLPEGSEIRGLNYSSDTPTVIYVDTNGNLRANTAGIANITVSSAENPEISVTQRFEAYDPDSLPAPTEINRDSNIPSQLSVGYSYINAAVKYNDGASDKTIWTSSDPETISVENTESPSCHLNVLKAGGPVQITATSALNPELSVTFEFTITDEPVPEDLYELSFRIQQNDDSYLINPDRYTVRLDDGFCLWLYAESDVCVPDVFAGSVRDQMSPFMKFAKGGAGDYSYEKDHIISGSAIMGTIINTGEYPVTFGNRTILINAIDSDEIILNSAKTEIDPDETLKIYASPDDNIEWSTSDEYVATVDENGIVTGIGGGTAIITAKAGDKESSIEIIVTGDPVERPLEAELITADEIYATEPTVLKATATGGSAPYKYQFTAKIDGKWTTLKNGTESECTYTFEKAGSYPVNVTVTDSAGTRVKSQKTLTVTVRPSEDPLDAELILAEDVYANEPTVLKAEATGGSAPYKYQFTAKIDGKWLPLQNGTESECTYTFEKAGSYPVNVTVTDSTGARVKSQKTLTVTVRPSEDPLDAELILAEDVYATEPTVLKASATGGSAPYKYQFTAKIDGKWTPLQNGTESECTYTFEKAGNYPVNVTVTDSTGARVKSQKTLTVTVRPSEDPLDAEIQFAEDVYATEPTVLKATATGGSAPYKYQFTAKIDGKWTTLHNGTESECTYTFEKAGSYPVNVTVTDSAGTRVKSQKTLWVLEP